MAVVKKGVVKNSRRSGLGECDRGNGVSFLSCSCQADQNDAKSKGKLGKANTPTRPPNVFGFASKQTAIYLQDPIADRICGLRSSDDEIELMDKPVGGSCYLSSKDENV